MNANDRSNDDNQSKDVDLRFVTEQKAERREHLVDEDPPIEEPPAPGDVPPVPLKAAAGDDDLMSKPPEPNAPRGKPLPHKIVSG